MFLQTIENKQFFNYKFSIMNYKLFLFGTLLLTATSLVGQSDKSETPVRKSEQNRFFGHSDARTPKNLGKAAALSHVTNKSGFDTELQKMDSLIYAFADGANWQHFQKDVYTYDNSGNLIVESNLYDNGEGWQESGTTDYTYDENGNLTLEIYQYWDVESNTIAYASKQTYAYNEVNKMIQKINFDFIIEGNLWIEANKTDFEYDESGNLTLKTEYYWSEAWILSSKTEYTCNGEGFVVQEIEYQHVGDDEWIEFEKFERTYDLNNRLSTEIRSWYSESGWVESNKSESTYNSEGQLVTEEFFDSNPETSAWEISDRDEFTYDEAGNMIQHIDYETPEFKTLIPDSKSVISYDLSVLFSNLVLPDDFFEPQFQVNKPLESLYYLWDTETETWADAEGKISLYYSEFSTVSVANPVEVQCTVSPNPVEEELNIHIPNLQRPTTIELFDIQGNMIQKLNISQNQNIRVGNLQSGLYFFRIQAGSSVSTGKFVKR